MAEQWSRLWVTHVKVLSGPHVEMQVTEIDDATV